MKVRVGDTTYDYDPTTLMLAEAMAVQVATGMKVPQWQKGLAEFDAFAIGALVWLLRRRAGERDLQFGDVDFNLADLDVEDEPDPTEAVATA